MTEHLTLLGHRMTRIFPILLFIGLSWGQDNTDRLILRNGSEFSGMYLGIIFGGVKFETVDKNIVKPPIKSIQKLSINALTIINNGQWVVPKEFVKNYQGHINQQNYDFYNITASNEEYKKKQVIELKAQKRRKTAIIFACCTTVLIANGLFEFILSSLFLNGLNF